MGLSLYAIADAIEHVLATEVDTTTGEISEETLAKLDELEMAREEKCLAIAAYIKGERCEAEAVKAEGQRLMERAKRHEKRAARLEEYVKRHYPQGAAKISDARSELRWQNNPPRVEIEEGATPPDDLVRVVPEKREWDKKATLKRLKFQSVKGARLVRSMRLVIS